MAAARTITKLFLGVTATLAVPPVDGHIPSVDPPHDGPDVHCLVNRLSSALDLRTPTGGFLQGNELISLYRPTTTRLTVQHGPPKLIVQTTDTQRTT